MPFLRIMGIIPLGIGITVLGFLWLGGSGPFAPPLFFKLFGSFIALAFVLQGAAMVSGQLTDPSRMAGWASRMRNQFEGLQGLADRERQDHHGEDSTAASSVGYRCSSCGAPLEEGADVSPHGDVKCGHCQKWFNIYKPDRG